ncbi:hypothetical protein GQR58_014353 [Nymphon striatum]|nr:hypothetical protein GQR58_014353 [Nymphon striatum]
MSMVSWSHGPQGDHEEADSLIAFHVANITAGSIIVRAADTDVLILIGTLGQQRPEVRSMANIIMDCGMGNSRRYINVTNIVGVLEDCKPGLPRALPGYHAFTGCDFTSAFYRKGKVKALGIVQKDKTGRFVNLFISMGDVHGSVDFDVASDLVCHMYAQSKTKDVDEARYNRLMQVSRKVDKVNPLANVKRVDCALLPPSRRTLQMKVLRAHTAVEVDSDKSIITGNEAECDLEALSLDELSDSDDRPWSEDSDSGQEENNDYM